MSTQRFPTIQVGETYGGWQCTVTLPNGTLVPASGATPSFQLRDRATRRAVTLGGAATMPADGTVIYTRVAADVAQPGQYQIKITIVTASDGTIVSDWIDAEITA